MRFLSISLILLMFSSSTGRAYERSDAFIVRVFDKSIRVLAPAKYDPKLNVIIENKTLVKSISRLERSSGKLISYVAVEAGKFTSVELKIKKGEVIYLVPISPPFQKIELVLGRKPYEIPPKR